MYNLKSNSIMIKLKKKQKEMLHVFVMYFLMAVLALITFLCSGCGTTKATISKPAEGTSTTITITTNNPITTKVNPNVELNK